MSSFPVLNSGAVVQYPLDGSSVYSSTVLSFLDGTQQRFALYGNSLRRWRIQLKNLDEREANELVQFFREQQGSFDTFAFTDPLTGTTYPACSFEVDQLTLTVAASGGASTNFTIREEG